ncbi:MAG TPA: hypothetical protein ENN29_03520 [Candidatus Hydrogenedentes bacterium]|nr:hypothetical protein [Candidatus Hydrogenedentota bacterium]
MDTNDRTLGRRQFLSITAGLGVTAAAGHCIAATDSASTQESFSFAVIADPHCAEKSRPESESLGDGVQKLLRCFEVLRRLPASERPDFALLAGDIHPDALAPHLDSIDVPIHAVAGNHEGSAESRGLLRSLFPEDFQGDGKERDYYSFVHKGVRFIGLCDAGMGGEHVGQFSSELIRPFGQCEWFEQELAMPEARKVVFAHIPPALDGGDRNMFMARNDSRWFVELVEKSPPDLLFFGHLHHATEAYQIGAAQAFNVRSCCWNFQNAPVGFMLAQVSEDGVQTREIITGEVNA